VNFTIEPIFGINTGKEPLVPGDGGGQNVSEDVCWKSLSKKSPELVDIALKRPGMPMINRMSIEEGFYEEYSSGLGQQVQGPWRFTRDRGEHGGNAIEIKHDCEDSIAGLNLHVQIQKIHPDLVVGL